MAEKPLQSLTIQGLNDIYVNTPLSTAPTFDTTQSYAVDDCVFYNKKLYKFTSAHPAGAWNSTHVTEITVGGELSTIYQDISDLSNTVDGKYEKPANGIPASDLAQGVIPDVSGKADKVNGATNGNFASLDANGNPTDSGHSHEDYLGKNEYATASQIKGGLVADKYIPPSGERNAVFYGLAKAAGDDTQSSSDNAVGTYTDEAKASIRFMLGAVGTTDYATTESGGVVRVNNNYGIVLANMGLLSIEASDVNTIKSGSNAFNPIVPYFQHASTFYGLAKAAGDTTQSASSNAVGNYTETAQSKIHEMLDAPVSVSGTTPTITGKAGIRYICGEVSTLSITPPASGIIDVIFTSGSTPTVLTVPSTVRWPEWFDPDALVADTVYEINIADGVYGAVMAWT